MFTAYLIICVFSFASIVKLFFHSMESFNEQMQSGLVDALSEKKIEVSDSHFNFLMVLHHFIFLILSPFIFLVLVGSNDK